MISSQDMCKLRVYVRSKKDELKKNLTLSSDTVTLPRYHGPKYVLIPGMKVL